MEHFQPGDAYIYEALQVPWMKSYIEKSRFGTPVYMITGLKSLVEQQRKALKGGALVAKSNLESMGRRQVSQLVEARHWKGSWNQEKDWLGTQLGFGVCVSGY